jgi:hypothetical protein
MTDFNKIKDIWQQKTVEVDYSKIKNAESDISRIKKQYTIRRIIITVLFATMLSMLIYMSIGLDSLSFTIGAVLLSFALFLITVMFWKYSTGIGFGNHSLSNVECINKNINNLKGLIKLPVKFLPIYAIAIVVGINLIHFDIIKEKSTDIRMLIHSVMTVGYGALLYIILRVKIRSVQSKINPIIDNLTELLNNLKSQI